MELTAEQQHKKEFVSDLNSLFVIHGDGRYDDMRKQGLRFVVDRSGEEFVVNGPEGTRKRVCVTGDSLKAMLSDMARAGVVY